MKDWILELCPGIQEWQADLIVQAMETKIDYSKEYTRQQCAIICDRLADCMPDLFTKTPYMNCANKIRSSK
jgi:hypothetical protein